MFTKSIVGSLSILAIAAATLPAMAVPINSLPRSGKVLRMVNGDIMCYVDLKDAKGKKHNLGATFEICEQQEKYLNRKVSITYKRMKVSNCQSAEPCGKTRWENLIVKLKLS
jgi:hypothetical protein